MLGFYLMYIWHMFSFAFLESTLIPKKGFWGVENGPFFQSSQQAMPCMFLLMANT